MPAAPPITLPTLGSSQHDFRSLIENFVLDKLQSVAGGNIKVQKYYKTANEEIYNDSLNLIQSGVPGWFFRTTKEDTNDASPTESIDDKSATVEIICASPVGIEKEVRNVDRYAYTMTVLAREVLRSNPIDNLPRNNNRPFIYNGNRDIFRDDELDIILADFNVNYVVV